MRKGWLQLLKADPRPWLLESDEPAARWVALTGLLGRSDDDPEVRAAHQAVLSDPGTQALIGRLHAWDEDTGASSHASPQWSPNLLLLLADMGVRGGDDARIENILDAMLSHQDQDHRFQAFGRLHQLDQPFWGSLLCDTHAITEVLVRFGREGDPRTQASLERMRLDLTNTAQGRAWPCRPEPVSGFRGPGRKSDFCPMVTLEAVRTFSWLPPSQRPKELRDVARVLLRAWRVRGTEKPYMFGFGTHFKTVKWPSLWFDALWMLDTLGRYPELWSARDARQEDRQALAEMAACLVAYNVGADGTVTPRSCYRGFERYSFGQKKKASPFATARLLAVLRRFDDLTEDIQAVDVGHLEHSKGGSGYPVVPQGTQARASRSREST